MPPPFIYLNGYPGVGKLTIARELLKLIPCSKLLHNHLLIDPVAAVFERNMPEYQPLRRTIRESVLNAIADSESTANVTWIFTDQQSSDPVGTQCAMAYKNAAMKRGNSPFISVIVVCELEENLRRATGRAGRTTKLSDSNIITKMRDGEDILHFNDSLEFIIDVTQLSPSEAAEKIHQHIILTSSQIGASEKSS